MFGKVPRPIFTTLATVIYAACAMGGRDRLYGSSETSHSLYYVGKPCVLRRQSQRTSLPSIRLEALPDGWWYVWKGSPTDLHDSRYGYLRRMRDGGPGPAVCSSKTITTNIITQYPIRGRKDLKTSYSRSRPPIDVIEAMTGLTGTVATNCLWESQRGLLS
jgi:hypothetical protein